MIHRYRHGEDTWEISVPDAYLYGTCVFCGAPRQITLAQIANYKTGTFDTTKSLQCSADPRHNQHDSADLGETAP